eukprot:3897354-Heterocapsa_arctica.AAC.1
MKARPETTTSLQGNDVFEDSAKIDSMTAESPKLKVDTLRLENELSKLAASQAEMDKLRVDEKNVHEEVLMEGFTCTLK